VVTNGGNEGHAAEPPLSFSEVLELTTLVGIREGFGPNPWNCSIETRSNQVVIFLRDKHSLTRVAVILGLDAARRLLRLASWLDSLTW
jgi:hypothetical protein